MNYKYIVLISLLFLINGCERGVGEEPIMVNDVNDNNLIGTWVLSERYTDKKYLKYLNINTDNYYFIIKDNNELEYHSFNPKNNRKILEVKGVWGIFDKNILLKKKYRRIYYLDAEGTYSKSNNNPKMKKPITKYNRISHAVIYEFRITKKNNKLLLWRYEGDYDARRYVMYEKKSK